MRQNILKRLKKSARNDIIIVIDCDGRHEIRAYDGLEKRYLDNFLKEVMGK